MPSDPPADVAGPAPLLVDARSLAALLGVSLRTIRALDAGGKLPRPIRLTRGCVRWKLSEIHDWINAGAPDRATWARIRAARS